MIGSSRSLRNATYQVVQRTTGGNLELIEELVLVGSDRSRRDSAGFVAGDRSALLDTREPIRYINIRFIDGCDPG